MTSNRENVSISGARASGRLGDSQDLFTPPARCSGAGSGTFVGCETTGRVHEWYNSGIANNRLISVVM